MRSHAKAVLGGAHHQPRSRARASFGLLPICVLVLVGTLTGQASASQTGLFKFKEAFGGASGPTFIEPTGVAVDQSDGDLLVMDRGDGTISRFSPDGTPADFSALGANVIDGEGGADETPPPGGLSFPAANEAQIAVDNSGTATDGDIYVTQDSPNVIDIFARSGEYLGRLEEAGSGHPFREACGVSVDQSGAVYVGDYYRPGPTVFKFALTTTPPVEDSDFEVGFSGVESACTLAAGAGPSDGSLFTATYGSYLYKQDSSTGNVDYVLSQRGDTTTETVSPSTGYVLAAQGHHVVEYDATGSSQAVELASLEVGSEVYGVAIEASGDTYVSRQGASGLEVWTHVPLPSVATAAPADVAPDEATLRGSVNPEGASITACEFEYGLTTSAGFENEVACHPSAAQIPPDSVTHEVDATVAGLQVGSTYKFRLVAANENGSVTTKVATFATLGPPRVSEIRALDATQGSATVEAKVNPSGFDTSYRFEWGPTTSYGHQAPAEFEPNIGSGTEPVRVNAKLTGLSAASAYHYRIVATSPAGTTAGPDETLETLNACGLPEGRCFELVSRREAGPVGIPGETLSQSEMHYQAATFGSGGLAYVTEAGYPEATKGAEVLYRGIRGPSGWSSTQLSPPIIAPNEQAGGRSVSGYTSWLANDLSCGFAESFQPLTDDPSMRLVYEYGSSNLYRINPDGSFTGVSSLAPENPEEASEYIVASASQDCGKVLFSTKFHYPGVPTVTEPALGNNRLYEWDEGTLRNAGVVPGPSGEMAVAAVAGTVLNGGLRNSLNTVSEDGSRVFFTAIRQTSPNPAEIGNKAVFVREDGATTRDVSLSETSVPDKEATYRWASPDGSRVFFTANSGLTDESSPEGTDLYMYDLESEELTDLTPYQGEGGAGVAGFIAATDDGSHAYFASPNQLFPGRGPTLQENQDDKTLSIYGVSDGEFSFVGTFSNAALSFSNSVVLVDPGTWASRISPDGRYLLFESSTKVTGYDSGGPREAYLYDAHGGSEGTVCVSCRPDGQPSVAPVYHKENGKEIFEYNVLPVASVINNPLHPAQFLTVHGGEPQVFFSSPDKLAPGAVKGQNNVYEWSHGQVFRLVSAREGQQAYPKAGHFAVFVGADTSGEDAYLVTPETLNWEDGDERLSVYDARVGGGFPEPPPPPPACDATAEGSCQGEAQGGPSAPGAASAAFSGPGNPAASTNQKKKAHKKKHAKKKHKRHTKRARHANAKGRARK